MALLINNKAIFLHTPKTGGTWLRHAMQVCSIPFTVIGEQHCHFPILADLVPPGFCDDKLIFTFVRHPLTWYQSRWAFRVQHGWHMDHPVDYHCASNSFHDFLRRMLAYWRSGWMTYLFGLYINNTPHPIDFVGKMENLVDDSVAILQRIGVEFDEQQFRGVPPMNRSILDGESSGYWAKYSPDLLKSILDVEKDIITKYYQNDIIATESFLCR